jgi:hypothetical protein
MKGWGIMRARKWFDIAIGSVMVGLFTAMLWVELTSIAFMPAL